MQTLKMVWPGLYFCISMVYGFFKRYVFSVTAYTNVALEPLLRVQIPWYLGTAYKLEENSDLVEV